MRVPHRRPGRAASTDLTCQQVVALVTAYLDDELTPAERAAFEAHLAKCENCPAHLQQIRATMALTGQLRYDDLAPGAQQDLLTLYRHWRAELSA